MLEAAFFLLISKKIYLLLQKKVLSVRFIYACILSFLLSITIQGSTPSIPLPLLSSSPFSILPFASEDCKMILQVFSCGNIPVKSGKVILYTDKGRKLSYDLDGEGKAKIDYCLLKYNFSVGVMKVAAQSRIRKKTGSLKSYPITEDLQYIGLTDSTYMYRTPEKTYMYPPSAKESLIKVKLKYRGFKLIGNRMSKRKYKRKIDLKKGILQAFLQGDCRYEEKTLIIQTSICQ